MRIEIQNDAMPQDGWRDSVDVFDGEMQTAFHERENLSTFHQRLRAARRASVTDKFIGQLVRFGLVTYSFMARTRPYAIVLIFILATIITPTPDILTLIAMSLPMCLLYESCIWIAWFMQRKALKNSSHG